ncbi:hypothetical protein G6F38_005424 [Rhizopus arrhizus]|nr:hypothetical protein G6F38_005424 [Rhizopus arrhizus]
MAGKGVVRSIKNYAKGFSEVQIKVREATSNDAWGPSGALMNEIAQLTFNEHDFIEIMDMLDKRLNDKGKNWRHVFKAVQALLVLDYCLHVGSENVVLYAKENIYVIRTLKEFQHIDDTGKDVGFNVRQKAKDITILLMDDQRLKEERRSRHQMQDRMSGIGDYMNDMMIGRRADAGNEVYRNPGYIDEDRELKRAIEESKRLAEQESRKRGDSDADLARAIQESEQEARELERKRKEQLDRENFDNLFTPRAITNSAQQQQQPLFNPFPTNQSFDASPNPYMQQQQQQWPQSTGMSFADPITASQPNNPYYSPLQAQMTGFAGLQAQMTGFPQTGQYSQPTGFPQTGFLQQQTTGINPIQSQTTGFNTIQPQSTGFLQNNPVQPQVTGFTGNGFSSPSNNPLQPQMTGRNPFGQTNASFGAQTTGSVANHERLNTMLLNREDGMDTFGNTGNLRIPHGTGYANSFNPTTTQQNVFDGNNKNNNNSLFSQPIEQQASRNPFGISQNSTPQQNKSLLELKQEQNLHSQMTAYNNAYQPSYSFF